MFELNFRFWHRTFHFFNLKKYLISRHNLNAKYLNPLWHKFHLPLSSINWITPLVYAILRQPLYVSVVDNFMYHFIAMNIKWVPHVKRDQTNNKKVHRNIHSGSRNSTPCIVYQWKNKISNTNLWHIMQVHKEAQYGSLSFIHLNGNWKI